MIIRDSAYLTSQSKSLNLEVDWSYHDYRDCNVQNYILAAKELADRGYYVIRMGAKVKEAINIEHPMIIDYATNGMRTDFMDIYLGAYCEFCISNGTGYEGVSYIFRKPILFIDHVPFGDINTYNKNTLITTKKHWLKSEERFMTFEEIFRSVAIFQRTKEFNKLKINLIESSPEEIKAVVIEMIERLEGKWQTTEEDEELQKRFWELFPSNPTDKETIYGEIRSRMGANFLSTNKDLFVEGSGPFEGEDRISHLLDEIENENYENLKYLDNYNPLDFIYKIPNHIKKISLLIRKFYRVLLSRNFNRSSNFLAKISVEIVNLFFMPIGFFIYLLMILISPFVFIRIGKFQSERIGHLSANPELFLCEKEVGINHLKRKSIELWYFGWPICNKQLARMWEREFTVIPRLFLAPIDNVISMITEKSNHRITEYENTDTDRDVHNLLDTSEPHLSFTASELAEGQSSLRAMGIPEGAKFVVMIIRDSAYLHNKLPWRTWSYHDYRDCNVQNYILAAKELADRGYYVIRMGAKVKEAINIEHPMIIDYATNGMRTDFMDIYLGAYCEFCISNGTGYDGVPTVFRRPILFIDHVPLLAISTFSDRDLITTKKHWLKDSNRFMTFEEIFNSSQLDNINPYNLHEILNLDLIESSPEEIKAVVIEMIERLEGKWQTTEEDEELQKRFWELFPQIMDEVALSHGEIRSRMGTSFLHNSKELLS